MTTTTPDEHRHDLASRPHAGMLECLRLIAAAGALALGLAGCGKSEPPNRAAPPKALVQPGKAHQAQRATGFDEPTAQFMAFALNALLVPLFDDDLPPRWADPSLSFDCDAGTVTVDDAPLDIGAPVPHEPFTVRWHMERCSPFDDAMALTGDIELRVEPSGAGYTAIVQPAQFHVVSARGDAVLSEAFTARMGLGR